MKKLIFILVALLMSVANYAEVVRHGNTFETVQSVDRRTPYTWKDKSGKVYPIYISSKGACYVKRISQKTGKQYKYYLPKKIQTQIKRELNITTK